MAFVTVKLLPQRLRAGAPFGRGYARVFERHFCVVDDLCLKGQKIISDFLKSKDGPNHTLASTDSDLNSFGKGVLLRPF